MKTDYLKIIRELNEQINDLKTKLQAEHRSTILWSERAIELSERLKQFEKAQENPSKGFLKVVHFRPN